MMLSGIKLSLDYGRARIQGGRTPSLPPKAALSRIRKILLLQPPEASPLDRYSLPTRYPLSLFTLAAALMQRLSNLEVVIADLGLPGMDVAEIVSDERPDMVGVTFMTPQYESAKATVSKAREILGEAVPIVGGGVHATALPRETLQEIDFDYLVLHEGETTLPDLMIALDRQLGLEKVDSIAYRRDGQVQLNPRRPRLLDLDSFPLATEVLPPGYLAQYAVAKGFDHEGVIAPIFASRGCSLACAFCASNVVFFKQAGVRNPVARSPEHVVAELRALSQEHGIGIVHFQDDYFAFDTGRANAIAEKIIAESLPLELSVYAIASRPTAQAADFYRLQQRAGLRRIALGVESGDETLMQRMGKLLGIRYGGAITRLAQAADVTSKYFLMVGLPGQDWASIEKTEQLLDKDRPDAIGVAAAMPYPGTRLANMPGIAMRGGYEHMLHEPPPLDKQESFVPYTQTDVMTSEEIGQARDRLLRFFAGLGPVAKPF